MLEASEEEIASPKMKSISKEEKQLFTCTHNSNSKSSDMNSTKREEVFRKTIGSFGILISPIIQDFVKRGEVDLKLFIRSGI